MTSPAALQRLDELKEILYRYGNACCDASKTKEGVAFDAIISEVEGLLTRREAEVRAESAKLHLELIEDGVMDERERVRAMVEGMKEETRNFPMRSDGGNWSDWNDGYDKALHDVLEKLKANN